MVETVFFKFVLYCERHLIFQYLIAANKTPEEIAEMEEPDDDELNLAMRVARGSAFALWWLYWLIIHTLTVPMYAEGLYTLYYDPWQWA